MITPGDLSIQLFIGSRLDRLAQSDVGSLEASENRLPFRVCDFTIAWPIVGRIQRGSDGFAEEAAQLDLLPIGDMQNKLKNGMLPRSLRT